MLPVDVVIPVRNRAAFIGAALASVEAQTLQPNAVLVVDDGSTDETSAILEEKAATWNQLRVIRTAPSGVSRARNRAVLESSAPLIAFLDSDDLWAPDKLQRQVALLSEDGERPGFVHCGSRRIDVLGRPLPGSVDRIPSRRGRILDPMLNAHYHVTGSASAVVARRALLLEVGLFDESLSYAEDEDLWLKLAARSEVDFDPKVLVFLRDHEENTYSTALERDPARVLIDKLSVWNKWRDRLAEGAALDRLRRMAVTLARKDAGSPEALYDALSRTGLQLVQDLFPDKRSFIQRVDDRPAGKA